MSSIILDLPSETTAITQDTIDEHATEGRANVKKVIIPKHVLSINEGAFYQCITLEEVILPESLSVIFEWAFFGCQSLRKIVLPNSLIRIDRAAFHECISLQEIVLPQSITEIGKGAFGACKSVKHIVLPKSITRIGECAFAFCESLVYVRLDLPSSIQHIGMSAFGSCSNLSVTALPQGKTIDTNAIHPWAFFGCEIINQVARQSQMAQCNLLQQRFDNLPLHQVCYDPHITLDSLTASIQQVILNDNNDLEDVDSFLMNALHILCVNPSATYELISKLVTALPSLQSGRSIERLTPAVMYIKSKYGCIDIIENKECLTFDDFLKHRILREDKIVFILALDDVMRNVIRMLEETKNEETGLYYFMSIALNKSYSLEAVYWFFKAYPHLLTKYCLDAVSPLEELKKELEKLEKLSRWRKKELEDKMKQNTYLLANVEDQEEVQKMLKKQNGDIEKEIEDRMKLNDNIENMKKRLANLDPFNFT